MSTCAASARTSPHVVHLCGPQKLPDEIAAATSRGSLAPDGHLYRRRRDRLRPTRAAYRGQSGCLPDQGRRTCCSPAEGLWRSGCLEVAAERFADQLGGGGSLGLGPVEQLAAELWVQPD